MNPHVKRSFAWLEMFVNQNVKNCQNLAVLLKCTIFYRKNINILALISNSKKVNKLKFVQQIK
jgi:hypothetical protein